MWLLKMLKCRLEMSLYEFLFVLLDYLNHKYRRTFSPQAKWLPQPLLHVGELFPELSPNEIHLLLNAVYVFLKVTLF